MNTLTDLLIRLQKEFPTDGQRHNITVGEGGTLRLTIFRNDKWFELMLDESDLFEEDKSIEEIRKCLA